MQAIYAFRQQGNTNLLKQSDILKKELLTTFDLFLFLLEFPQVYLTYLSSELEIEKQKFYPDKNKIRIVENLSQLEIFSMLNAALKGYQRHLFVEKWENYADRFNSVKLELEQQEFYNEFTIFDNPGFSYQKDFILNLYDYLLNGCELFDALITELYPTWVDDEPTCTREIFKLFQHAKQNSLNIPKKDNIQDEDIEMGGKLFQYTLENEQQNAAYINELSDNWDAERLAVLDLIIIEMGITEFMYFPVIPIRVTMNEYLEIAKDYSTPQSSKFINGILDSILKKLEKEKRIIKTGRGLN